MTTLNGVVYNAHNDVFTPAALLKHFVAVAPLDFKYPTGIKDVEDTTATLRANPTDPRAYEDLACAYISQAAYCMLRDDAPGAYTATIGAFDTLELMEEQLGEVSTRTLVIAAAASLNASVHSGRGGAWDVAIHEATRMMTYLVKARPYERNEPLFQSVRDEALNLLRNDHAGNPPLQQLASQISHS